MQLGADELLQLAPDAASAKAARSLVVPGKWPRLEYDEGALWGECQGSGSKPYRVQMDLSGPAFRCTCPSRKFPCKHGLALALLRLQHADRFSQAPRPDWVEEWLQSRQTRAAREERKQAAAAGQPAAAPDPQAAARREAKRERRMEEGLAELALWLKDRLRQGLAQLPGQPEGWTAMAARMVDAQLPGLAERLRRTGAAVGADPAWPVRTLGELGRLQLLIDGARRLADLPPPVQADLGVALGLVQDKDGVIAEGERVADDWLVLGVRQEDEEKLRVRRVWLAGEASGRRALLLDFAYGSASFEPPLLTGQRLAMTLAFYPGAASLRALILDGPRRLPEGRPPALAPLAEELERLARAIAANPWGWPRGLLARGVPAPGAAAGWTLRIDEEASLRLRIGEDDAWQLAAESGGSALAVFGEWDGDALRPLAAWAPELAPEPLWYAGSARAGAA